MDFFILLSSLSRIAGLYRQANYASGNTYQDSLARTRVMHGEKAVSLDLCNMLDIGYVSRQEDLDERLTKRGYGSLEEAQFHALLDYYCNPELTPECLTSQVVIGIRSPATHKAQNLEIPPWMDRPLFMPLHNLEGSESKAFGHKDVVDYQTLICGAETMAQAVEVIVDGLSTKLANTLAVGETNIDPGKPIYSYGVDSLSAVEIRTWFRNQIGADVSVFDILGNNSLTELAATVATNSQFVPSSLKTASEVED